MGCERIESIDDPRVAEYRAVRDAELARTRGLFVAEGRLVVERLIADGRYTLRSVLVSEAAREALAPALASMPGRVPIYVCRAADLRGITGFDLHRGCLALAERPAPVPAAALVAAARLVVALDGVGNADNVGGVFRNAAAFGVDAVLLGPTCCDPLYRKAIRTSMAATLRVPFARVDDWAAALALLRAAGFRDCRVDAAGAGRGPRRVRRAAAPRAPGAPHRRGGHRPDERVRGRRRPPRAHRDPPRGGLAQSRRRLRHRPRALSPAVRTCPPSGGPSFGRLQNVRRAPTSRRRGGAADTACPKNGDVSTPLKFSAFR